MLGQEDSKTAFWNQLHLPRMQHFCFWIACHVGNALLFFYCILYQMFIAEAHTSENMLVFGITRTLATHWFDMHCPSQYENLNSVCPAAEVDKKFILFFQPARIQLPLEELLDSCRTNSWGTKAIFSESHSHHACVGKRTFQPCRVSPVLFAERIIPVLIICKAHWNPQWEVYSGEKNSVKLSDSSVRRFVSWLILDFQCSMRWKDNLAGWGRVFLLGVQVCSPASQSLGGIEELVWDLSYP